ncbi:hypothetical protein R3751_05090 [Halorubrum distributum]|uniref:hypothetical protein n=1 Tax=Halorubrum distributum TaxID=29283 RepID=UPI002953959E|nr:hypothetical protein [Halorubrum distributum]MDV7349155.1 hypothetical protein [Halorubrum distributum]
MSDGDRSDGDDAPEADPFDDEPFGEEQFDDEPSGDGASEGADDGLDDPDAHEVDDPFAALGDGIDDGGEASPRADPEPGASVGPETGASEDPEPGAPADDPFAELDADAAGSPTDEDPFESMGSGDVGEEDVWEALDEGTSVGADATEFDDAAEGGAVGDLGQTPGPGTTGDERVVDKRSYCQRCPHFTAPPETACTHEGTEIVESVDFSRFRVRNCPMVDAEDPAFDGE